MPPLREGARHPPGRGPCGSASTLSSPGRTCTHRRRRRDRTSGAAVVDSGERSGFPSRDGILPFIRRASPDGEADLLPGLCLFTEQWFWRLGFASQRDTAEQPPSPSLMAYFEDGRVQAYLSLRVRPGGKGGRKAMTGSIEFRLSVAISLETATLDCRHPPCRPALTPAVCAPSCPSRMERAASRASLLTCTLRWSAPCTLRAGAAGGWDTRWR